MKSIKLFTASLVLVLIFIQLSFAQMERRRVVTDGPVEDIFLTQTIGGMSTVTNLPKQNLGSSIMHNFGLVSGGIESFFGLDEGASVRLGIDYGITDRLSAGIGRSSLENNVDLRMKYTLLQQLESDKVPLQLAVKGDVGINTQEENRFDFTFTERLNYFASLMAARKFNDNLSLQVAPMISHFNTVVKESAGVTLQHTHFAIGIGGRYKLNERNALAFEYIPVIGERNTGTTDHLTVSFEIDTGGHVFQMFLMSGRWFTEQHLITRTNTKFTDLDFRFGFNVNRVFRLGK